jgi:biopolymer transport protein ExbD
MTRIASFVFLFFLLAECASPDSEVKKISITDPPVIKKRENIMISIDGDQQLYLGTRKVDTTLLDSLLPAEIRRLTVAVDTPTVVVNADTAATYGLVFRVIKLAKKHGAKAVATVR